VKGEKCIKSIAQVVVPVVVLILILSGLPYVFATSSEPLLSGKVLHVYSHSLNGFYMDYHIVDLSLSAGDNFTIEQAVLAANYSGSAGVALLEVQVKIRKGTSTRTRWYSIYWYGGNSIMVWNKNVSLNMGVPHEYKITVLPNEVLFYVDGKLVDSVTARVTKIQQINLGRWADASTYDLYVDNVREYFNGDLIASDDFEDSKDDFYTGTPSNPIDSGEDIISYQEVPEYPFLAPFVQKVENVLSSVIKAAENRL